MTVVGYCIILLIIIISTFCAFINSSYEKSSSFINEWAVQIDGNETVAKSLASKHGFIYITRILEDYYLFRHPRISKRSLREATAEHLNSLQHENKVKWLQQQSIKRRVKRDVHFTDNKWPRMWYLNGAANFDMNLLSTWEAGYTGKGVVVTVLDDGIEKDHPDLKNNYDAQASYDVNDQDPDPQPRYEYTNENRHGTRCAGEIAAEANNGVCSVGVAYNARIGGVRMLDGEVSDAVEAQSLTLRPHYIDIFSISWGPDDDGKTVDGPGPLARKAFSDGVLMGRRGLGSIFIWASGNGGKDGDGCNCDGYTNNIYTLSISSVTESGQVPWYSEACSSTLATTFSSGTNVDRQIVTTDLRKGCTEGHTGTSASAPLAAGVCALVLQANSVLTWRDIQYIIVLTARPDNLQADDWQINGVGKLVSHYFGYGMLDAYAMVQVARNWSNVPEQHRCEITSKHPHRAIPMHNQVESIIYSDGCHNDRLHHVQYLEHVVVMVTLTSTRRGEVEVYITSPRGTRSTLLARRPVDSSMEGFNNWSFMTTHCWGEGSDGVWRLEVRNGGSFAKLVSWSLVLYGTQYYPLLSSSPISQSFKKFKDKRATSKPWTFNPYGTLHSPHIINNNINSNNINNINNNINSNNINHNNMRNVYGRILYYNKKKHRLSDNGHHHHSHHPHHSYRDYFHNSSSSLSSSLQFLLLLLSAALLFSLQFYR